MSASDSPHVERVRFVAIGEILLLFCHFDKRRNLITFLSFRQEEKSYYFFVISTRGEILLLFCHFDKRRNLIAFFVISTRGEILFVMSLYSTFCNIQAGIPTLSASLIHKFILDDTSKINLGLLKKLVYKRVRFAAERENY
jgi:hypothetical protein